MGNSTKKYRPSNGTEGMAFMSEFCDTCIHENAVPDKKPNCEIMTNSMCLGIDDKDYPSEWTYDKDGKPICTKFKKWDWINDGDPYDPNNPKAPVMEDPNQLKLEME